MKVSVKPLTKFLALFCVATWCHIIQVFVSGTITLFCNYSIPAIPMPHGLERTIDISFLIVTLGALWWTATRNTSTQRSTIFATIWSLLVGLQTAIVIQSALHVSLPSVIEEFSSEDVWFVANLIAFTSLEIVVLFVLFLRFTSTKKDLAIFPRP